MIVQEIWHSPACNIGNMAIAPLQVASEFGKKTAIVQAEQEDLFRGGGVEF